MIKKIKSNSQPSACVGMLTVDMKRGTGYSYRFNCKWSIALEANIEGGNYLIKGDIQRENVFIIAAVAGYELMPRWGLFFGGGIEIENHKNYAVMRLATDYLFPIGKDWDISPEMLKVFH